jgi:REP element-mobilizing transposase RayT
MPRRSPITVAEVPVHIIQRGNNRGACFFADTDDELYLAHLRVLAAKFECAVHATCLMTNHVHLLLTPQRACGCALLMKHLGQRHVPRVNRTYRRSGTLWEGRFRSCLPGQSATCTTHSFGSAAAEMRADKPIGPCSATRLMRRLSTRSARQPMVDSFSVRRASIGRLLPCSDAV